MSHTKTLPAIKHKRIVPFQGNVTNNLIKNDENNVTFNGILQISLQKDQTRLGILLQTTFQKK